MIKRKVHSILVASLIASSLNFVVATPAKATNPACVLNTDYTETVVADSVTVTFTNSAGTCDWSVPSTLTRAEIAIVGGGGSGGFGNQGGGGGGGEVLYASSAALTAGGTLEITVGAGGAAASTPCTITGLGTPNNTAFCPGNNGRPTSVNISGTTITALGGGRGGGAGPFDNISKKNGATGGSSGGGNRFGVSVAATSSSFTGWTSYVNTGGRGGGNTTDNTAPVYGGGGGGGGAGSAGTSTSAPNSTSTPVVGVGGNAIYLIGRCLSGGGSGFGRTTAGVNIQGAAPGCTGIAVAPNRSGGASGQAGAANTGGGGGTAEFSPGQPGGSGVVILKYSTILPTQTITFDSIANKTFSTSTFSAPATTDALGETVTVTSSNTSICTYAGETVTLVATGTCTLTASQAGSTLVQAASNVVRSFQISKGTPTLGAFTALTKTYGNSSFNLDTVTSTVPGAFTFTSLNTSVLTISTRTATIAGAGTANVRLLFTPTDTAKWETATVTGTINVNKRALTVVAPSVTVEYGSLRSTFSASMNPSYLGFVSGETQSVLNTAPICVESETYTATTSTVNSPYSITCSGASDDNYSFTYTSGLLTVNKNDMNEYTDAQLISADSASVVYGDVVTFTQAAVGQFTSRFTGACTQLSTWTARATSASGTCTGTFTQSNANYESRTVVMNIPTLKRQLTISRPSVADKRYDGATTTGAVTVGTLGNLYGSETVLVTGSASAFSTADAGAGKISTITYSISNGTGLASNYFAPADETVTATVLKAQASFNSWSTITISLSSAGESITAPTVTSPLSGGTFSYAVGNSAIATLESGSIIPVTAGTTTLSATYSPTDSTNYETGTATATLTISKGNRTIAFGTTTYSKTYGDASFSVSATPSVGASDGDITYTSSGGACSVNASSGSVTIIRAGSCSISATISTGANYDQVTTTTPATVNVSRKTLSISGTSIAARTYTGTNTPGALTIGTLSGLASGETLTLTALASNLSSPNVATYTTSVLYTLGNGSNGVATNYLLADESITAVVQKKLLRITASNGTTGFGSSAPTITPIYDGFVGSEDASVLDSAPTCTSNYTNTSPAGSTLTSSCSGASDGNYSFTYVAGTVTVTTNSRTISLSISDVTLQYGETATLTSSVSAGALDGTITYLTSQPSLCSISGNTVRAVASVGTCQIATSIGAGANYSAVTSAYTAVTLSKRELTVTSASVSNKIYDGSDSATVTSAALSGVLSGDLVQLSPIARFANKNVGNSKAVTSQMSISGRDAGNYQLNQPSLGNANITARNITITGLSVLNRNFDSTTAATITGTPILNGLVAGDSLTVVGFRSGVFATMGPGTGIAVSTTMSLAGSDVANYQLTAPTLSGDIPLILANTITITPIASKRYGTAPFSVNATASSGLPVQLSARGRACSILGYEITILRVGICEITAEQSGDATYEAAETVTDSFTVLAAEITLTVDNKAIVVGSQTPANSYLLTGALANGETISNVNYRYSSSSYSSSATAPTASGVYTISISSITLTSGDISNYSITYVDGTYSIGSTSDKNLSGMIVFVPGRPDIDYLFGAFTPNKYSYSVLLPPSATTLKVTIARSSVSTFKSQVRINDSGYRTLKYTSNVGGTADSGNLPVSAASNSILILITAPDKSTLTYTINVYKEVATRDTTTVTSSNVESIVIDRNNQVPTVASSVITGMTFTPSIALVPSFSLTTYAYNATVPATQSSIAVTAAFQGTGFVIKVRVNNGGFRAVNNGGQSQPMSLIKGSNQLFVRVESVDGSVVVYTFAITRL
jgi:hypothetical protein